MTKSLISQLPPVKGVYRANSDLSKVNWFNVGGPAEVLYRPANLDDLLHFIKHKRDSVKITPIGVGSNLLVRDGGIDGVVIRLGRGFVDIVVEGDVIAAGAGALDFNIAETAAQHELGGLEFMCGIPGTVGGALAMNAGAYGSDTASVLIAADVVDNTGKLRRMKPAELEFRYRGNGLPADWIFVKAYFKAVKTDPEAIRKKMFDINVKREATQPVRSKTTGSTFANPGPEISDKKAWQLIDEAGCRGFSIGAAQVSEMHCNFLINNGGASASDIEILGETVRKRVFEHSGVELQWEIRRIGKV